MSRALNRLVMRTLSLLLLAAVSAGVHAADTWYMVELIVFTPTRPDSGSEVWPTDQGINLPALNTALAVPRAAGGESKDARLQPLPVEQYRLQAEAKRLEDGNNYRILLHSGWRQPGLAREEAIAVRLQSQLPAATATDATPAPSVLDGTVRLILSRYLHLETDLLYRPEASEAGGGHGFFASSEPVEVPAYHMHETRRMRSKEVHYLDHPMFGVIALVTPYEVATPAVRTPAPPVRHQ